MRRIALVALAISLLAPVLASAPAHAQATRTWVSGVGDDVNPCSRTAPCKTFAGAISKTAAGGEINCLDPAGYGAVTITKAMTLNCAHTLGSILVSGTPGIIINAAAADRITLRGIQLQGLNQTASPGTFGVRILAAAGVSIEDSVITAFGQHGISDERAAGNVELFIRNTVIKNNTGSGINFPGTSGSNSVAIENSSLVNNTTGIKGANLTFIMMRNSVIAENNTGIDGTGGQIDIDSSNISSNGTGATSNGSTIRLSNSDFVLNGTAGAVVSYGNNRMVGNGSAPSITSVALQ